MTARSVFKLFSKTYSYTLHGTCPQTISSLSKETKVKKQPKSCSRLKHSHSLQKHHLQLRRISKSLENLREIRHREEDLEQEPDRSHYNAFPPVADPSIRDPAKEFKDHVIEEKNEEGNPIYELAECTRSEENVFDVMTFMRKQEDNRQRQLFLHLQPNNLKPYGSNENLHYPNTHAKRIKIVYPTTGNQSESKKKRVDSTQHKEFSTHSGTNIVQKEYLGYDDKKKLAVCDSNSKNIIKMNYSTTSKRSTKFGVLSTRKSSTAISKRKKNKNKRFNEVIATYETYKKPEGTCSDYITVKLGNLKSENSKKAKKISFGRLPKLTDPDCPCLERPPMKPGEPLLRLKKRFDIPDRDNTCKTSVKCITERADDNYQIKMKTLPVIEPKECPCQERQMTDFVIRRLPKKKIPEPPRICKIKGECITPRSDVDLTVKPKRLPKLQINDCPCIEKLSFKDVPLKRLEPKPIKEPERVCRREAKCDAISRADEGLKVERKVLPQLKGECECVERPPMQPGAPLVRLPKIKYTEEVRKCHDVTICQIPRADDDRKIQPKKLPVFVPQECPCIEKEPPTTSVGLKRLPKKIIKQAKKVCKVKEVCAPRADDGLVIKPKQLPALEPKECPCVERVLQEGPQLKRLPPVSIPEPPKICKVSVCDETMVRSDHNLKVKPKKLPVLPPGDCPCTEKPLPKPGKPLAKLKKKPVTYTRICKAEIKECPPRADEGLQVKSKKLPKLQINDCPCKERPPLTDVPLTRLRKVDVPEPVRVCPKVDDCEEIPRADEDDWLYWKHIVVNPCNKPKDKRNFSTSTRRRYSTSTRIEEDLFKTKYDVPRWEIGNKLNDKAYNIIIDIKPSTPLILTQKPVDLNQLEDLESGFETKTLRRPKSEPADCVTFVIYKSNGLGGGNKSMKEGSSDVSLAFNRFISTCSSLCDSKNKKDKTQCGCPPNLRHLQPKNPIIAEREQFVQPFPDDDHIEGAVRKSRRYYSSRKDDDNTGQREVLKSMAQVNEEENKLCAEELNAKVSEEQVKKLTLWEKIVNYFKARPDCPSPDEYKKLRLREQAEKAASKAGMCLYDPKEILHRNEKDMPKVISAGSLKEEECNK